MLLFLGDIHGNFNDVKHTIKRTKMNDCTIIQVGDFGVGFVNEIAQVKILKEFNEYLNERDIILYAIRGNHDDPAYFTGKYQYSNLKLIPDYSVLNINDYNILLIGGATSIDRIPRIKENMDNMLFDIEKTLYWEDEVLVYNENHQEFIKSLNNIDVVVTHTTPNFCTPNNDMGFPYIVEAFAKNDKKLKDDLISERNLMKQIFDDIKSNNNIKYHFYGHFHFSNLDTWGTTQHRLLAINEFYELRR